MALDREETERGAAQGTVARALALLDDVAAFGRPVRFVDLLRMERHPRATLHRLLRTLVDQQMLDHDETRKVYTLGARLMRLAHAAWSQSSLAEAGGAALDALSRETGLTAHLAQLDGGQVLYVDKRHGDRPTPMFSDAGKVGPAYCTGVGKAMLAHLTEPRRRAAYGRQSFHRYTPATICDAEGLERELAAVRAEGIAFDWEEHEPGVICIAAPIFAEQSACLGAVSLTASTSAVSLAELKELAPRLLEAAETIGREAGLRFSPAYADRAKPSDGGGD